MRVLFVKMVLLLCVAAGVMRCLAADSEQTMVMIAKYNRMSIDQLLEMGDLFSRRNVNDSAMMCYALIYNGRGVSSLNARSQQVVCKALNRASAIYLYHCNYKVALELLLRALEICDEIGYGNYVGRIYNNIGNVYCRLRDYKAANRYYRLAYENGADNYVLGAALNNLGMLAHQEGKLDSALLLYKQACGVKTDVDDSIANAPLNNIALICQALKSWDSALFYYNKGLANARKLRNEEKEAKILSNIGQMYFELDRLDSAEYYLGLSSVIAKRAKLPVILSNNYLSFSEIEERRGDVGESFDYYKRYTALKDSVLSASEYGALSEVQFVYDMSKLDKQIKELNAEQEIKERTIVMQRRLQGVMGVTLLTVIVFLVMLFLKNRKLNMAYGILVAKNLEIISSDKINYQSKLEYEERLREKEVIIERLSEELAMGVNVIESGEDDDCGVAKTVEVIDVSSVTGVIVVAKHQCGGMSDDYRKELELAILEVMNNKEVFCDADFSLTKLSEMVGSNFNYISQIINGSFNSNFKTFINEYRIKEACRMFSDPEYRKYSIETIANMVGFKSKGSFNPTFKEIIGVTPSFYIRQLKSK